MLIPSARNLLYLAAGLYALLGICVLRPARGPCERKNPFRLDDDDEEDDDAPASPFVVSFRRTGLGSEKEEQDEKEEVDEEDEKEEDDKGLKVIIST
ncbi:hypothetical protein HZH66_010148 [Vespula vulgaris]|uniref:Uncharacterized protein n=1 Tax=Vespula vulgaris TaxID=7454 RepID=A0A834JP81_VESVU|nr:hypothetical protein HZH66_010148 [Vespula vulgaris]